MSERRQGRCKGSWNRHKWERKLGVTVCRRCSAKRNETVKKVREMK
jgi:hypothetical protein